MLACRRRHHEWTWSRHHVVNCSIITLFESACQQRQTDSVSILFFTPCVSARVHSVDSTRVLFFICPAKVDHPNVYLLWTTADTWSVVWKLVAAFQMQLTECTIRLCCVVFDHCQSFGGCSRLCLGIQEWLWSGVSCLLRWSCAFQPPRCESSVAAFEAPVLT